MTDTVVKDLVINVGTTAQIEAAIQGGTITENMLSIATDCGASSPNLFDVKWSDYLLSDSNWLRADTFSWNSGTTYSDMYNHLVADISGVSSSTETIGSYTVTFYRASDGHKIVLANQETTVTNIYNSTGIAWYYILDTTNTRFKLPRTKFNFTGLRGTVGNYVAPGLPNITGTLATGVATSATGIQNGIMRSASGAFTLGTDDYTRSYASSQSTTTTAYKVSASFKASNSNSIYGNDSTVQPPATQMYLYFYAGQHTQTATEQTAGLNSSLFTGKVDLDGNNATFSHVITTYTSGANWYRLYSGGWCEQGGTTPEFSGKDSTVTVNLLKPFANTNYCVQLTTYNAGYRPVMYISSKATASFAARRESDNSSIRDDTACWYACGKV